MAAILGHAPSQLRPQSKMLRILKGRAPRSSPRPLDSERKTSLSAQPSCALASLWCFLPQPPSHSPLPTPRPAQWFLLLCTPATKMVSPCCLHSDIPPPTPPLCTRALATPDYGYQDPLPALQSNLRGPGLYSKPSCSLSSQRHGRAVGFAGFGTPLGSSGCLLA